MLRGFLLVVVISYILDKAPTTQNASPGPQPKNSTCVRRFYEERSHFDACRKVPCFVFLTEIPFVVPDKKMTSEQDVKLFPCKDRKKTFPDLKGISFDIMDELPLDNAQCVWAGPHCSYEGMMQFIAREKDYQFAVGGLMFVLPHRVTNDTRPSSPLLDDKVVIVGKRDSKSALALAYITILRPFQLGTWMIVLGIVLFFALARILVAAAFVEKPYYKNILYHCMGEYDSVHIRLRSEDNQETARLLNKAAVGCLSLAVSIFFVIVLLLYEIAVVNFIFMKQPHVLRKGLAKLSEEDMKRYVIIKGGAMENLWRQYVDPENHYVNRTPPWHFCTGEQDCYDKILSDNHPAKFSMSYEVRKSIPLPFGQIIFLYSDYDSSCFSSAFGISQPVVRYELKQRRACELLTVYETSTPLYGITGGWFYGGVPSATQLNIDKEILKLRLHDKIGQLVNRVIDTELPLNCAALGTDIPAAFLGWLVLTLVVACMIPVAVAVICVRMLRRNEQGVPNTQYGTIDA